jgi:hypothetical protein
MTVVPLSIMGPRNVPDGHDDASRVLHLLESQGHAIHIGATPAAMQKAFSEFGAGYDVMEFSLTLSVP